MPGFQTIIFFWKILKERLTDKTGYNFSAFFKNNKNYLFIPKSKTLMFLFDFGIKYR